MKLAGSQRGPGFPLPPADQDQVAQRLRAEVRLRAGGLPAGARVQARGAGGQQGGQGEGRKDGGDQSQLRHGAGGAAGGRLGMICYVFSMKFNGTDECLCFAAMDC